MPKPKIWTLIHDVDGCLANWNEPFFDLLQELHGPPPGGPPKLEVWDWPRRECGYTYAQVDKAWMEVNDDWWLSLPPLPGCTEALDKLQWLEYEGLLAVYFVTGRLPWARKATREWLDGCGYLNPQVITTSDKHNIVASFVMNGSVAAVEDKPAIINNYLACGDLAKCYIISAAYNQHIPESEDYLHVPTSLAAAKDIEAILIPKSANAPEGAEVVK